MKQDVDVVENATGVSIENTRVGALTGVATHEQEVDTTFNSANVRNTLIVCQSHTCICTSRDVPECNSGNGCGSNHDYGKSGTNPAQESAPALTGCHIAVANSGTRAADAARTCCFLLTHAFPDQ